MKKNSPISRLFRFLDSRRKTRIFVQTHDFPDPDALASALGIQTLLKALGRDSTITYAGSLGGPLVDTMIETFGMNAVQSDSLDVAADDLVIVVDGCKDNRNVTDLPGFEVAVIDHHQSTPPSDVPFTDIRPWYGACATLVHEYFSDAGVTVPRPVATALLLAIRIDTARLSRGVNAADMKAYSDLWHIADTELAFRLERNNYTVPDLVYFSKAIESLQVRGRLGFLHLDGGPSANLMGIMADFFLAAEELDYVVIACGSEAGVRVSVRSEDPSRNAANAVVAALFGIGSGGGHADMAGGMVRSQEWKGPSALFERFAAAFGETATGALR